MVLGPRKYSPFPPKTTVSPYSNHSPASLSFQLKGGRALTKLIKILHIDPDYQITYLIYGPGSSIRTSVPLQTAIDLLKEVDFDLILSEPHNKAILKKEYSANGANRIKSDDQPFKEADDGYLGEVRPNRYS
jgi:hypothetical protein